jgi:hypothetical protein
VDNPIPNVWSDKWAFDTLEGLCELIAAEEIRFKCHGGQLNHLLSGGVPLPSGDMEKIHRSGDAHSPPDRSNFCSRDFSLILGDSSVQVSLQPRPMKLSPQRKFFPVRLGPSRDAIPRPTSQHRKQCLQQASQKCI